MGMVEAIKRIIGLERKQPEVPPPFVMRRRARRRKLPERRVDRVDRDWGEAAE